ncbi:hypothetical protein ES705_48920 [subsurface metagenome]
MGFGFNYTDYPGVKNFLVAQPPCKLEPDGIAHFNVQFIGKSISNNDSLITLTEERPPAVFVIYGIGQVKDFPILPGIDGHYPGGIDSVFGEGILIENQIGLKLRSWSVIDPKIVEKGGDLPCVFDRLGKEQPILILPPALLYNSPGGYFVIDILFLRTAIPPQEEGINRDIK